MAGSVNLTEVSYMDKWNGYSIDIIGGMQKNLNQHEWWFVQASVFGDNSQAFTFFFPLIAGLLHMTGVKALWASILVEWTNLLLKWMFMGDRPYWWSQTTSMYTKASRPQLAQFPNTCESGPGTPSGHLMMNVALFYVISQGLIKNLSGKKMGILRKLVALAITVSYMIWVIIVFMSRLYIQAHFLHQCLLGMLLGFVLGKVSHGNTWLAKMTMVKALLLTIFVGGSVGGAFVLLKSYGMDPLWAIPLAKKYCSNKAFVRVETQPYFLMARLTGATLGLGLGMTAKIHSHCPLNKGFMRSFVAVALGLVCGKLILIAQGMLPSVEMFLAFSFGGYFLLCYFVVYVIPKTVYAVFH